jgi:hypothetical protein
MGSVRLDSLYEYIAVDSNYSGVAGGHVERINYGDNDNGLLALAIVYLPPAMASDFHLLQPQVVEATHLTVIGSGSQTQLQFDNTQTPTLNAALFRKLPVSTSKTRVHKQVIPIDTTQRGVTDMFWMVWRSSANPGNKLWKLSLRYTEVKNSNTSIAGA